MDARNTLGKRFREQINSTPHERLTSQPFWARVLIEVLENQEKALNLQEIYILIKNRMRINFNQFTNYFRSEFLQALKKSDSVYQIEVEYKDREYKYKIKKNSNDFLSRVDYHQF